MVIDSGGACEYYGDGNDDHFIDNYSQYLDDPNADADEDADADADANGYCCCQLQ